MTSVVIYHIAYHRSRKTLPDCQIQQHPGTLNGAFAVASYAEGGAAGKYRGSPDDGFNAAAWVEFKDIDGCAISTRATQRSRMLGDH